MRTVRIALIALCVAALAGACKKDKKTNPGSAAGTATGSGTAAAKTPPPKTKAPPPKMGRRARWAKRRLDALKAAAKLTDEQATKVAELMKAERKARRDAWKANPGAEGKDKRKAAKAAARKATDDALKKMLKPDQFAGYTKLRDDWAAKRKARREARRKRMAEELAAFAKEAKLKPKQVKKLAALMKEARKAHRVSWRAMKGMDKDARKAKRKEMREAINAKVQKVLNKKQFAAYEAWHKKMREERRKRWRERRGSGAGAGGGGDDDGSGS